MPKFRAIVHLLDQWCDTRLLGPYITEVLEVVGGSPLFCQFGVGAAWRQKIAVLRPYRGRASAFFGRVQLLDSKFSNAFFSGPESGQNSKYQVLGIFRDGANS